MIYLTDKNDIFFRNTAVTMGKFDGVHRGHQKLLQELLLAKEEGMTTVVFTFHTPPSAVLYHQGKQLVTAEEKRYLYEESGVDVLIDYPADKEFFALTPEAFIRRILVEQLGTKRFIAGPDFRFGNRRAGDIACLQEAGRRYQFSVRVLDKEQYDRRDISSSFIKEEMERGNLAAVEEMQGHPYFFLGRASGKEWIQTFPEEKLLPKPGIYTCSMVVKGDDNNRKRLVMQAEPQPEPVICEVLDGQRIKITQLLKNCWTDSEECAILFRCV